jgi:hypothetical protein
MTLHLHATYPSARSYVLKLHRDASPQRGQFFGRLESMASGRHYDFSSGEELLACLARDVALATLQPESVGGPLAG